MSGVGAVTPAKTQLPVEQRPPPERDGGKKPPPREPRKGRSEDDLVEVERRNLDVEA